MMKKQRENTRRPLKSMTAVTLLLAGAMLVSWGASMYVMTIVTAQEFYHALYKESIGFRDFVDKVGHFSDWYDELSSEYGKQQKRPDQLEYHMLEAIQWPRNSLSTGRDMYDLDLLFLRDMNIPMETAVLFYDKDGNIIHKNSDFVYFTYATQEMWDAGEEDTMPRGYGWFDLEDTWEGFSQDYDVFYSSYLSTWVGGLPQIRVLRITGVMDGTRIKPAALDCLPDRTVTDALAVWDSSDTPRLIYVDDYSNGFKISDLDRAGLLEWQTQFDHTAQVEHPEELVTIYAIPPKMCVYEGSSLSYQGERYDSLAALAEELDFPSWTDVAYYNMSTMNEFSLNRILCFDGYVYRDWAGYDPSDENAPYPEPDFIMVTAVVSHPLQAAVSALRNVYIGTGVLALLLVLFLRNRLKKRLVEPVGRIADGMEEGWTFVYTADNKPKMWREAEGLYRHYSWEIDGRRCSKNEIARLEAALRYAQRAEENRRQMTSSIAHELKTPLAIIHSYSEGLKEHIAEDKRDQYLDVILAEAERMDGMVLEMLDLSRLEAGKVKLSRDVFSLSALARTVFEKMSALAEEKGLQITLELDGDCPVLADEARIEQVIANFASNAVRYTPEGGSILVKTQAGHKLTSLSVENTSQPFTPEELSRVWETFYQTSPAREGKGTGLGLAIAKSIVTLHGGTCSVRNTGSGVEFCFAIPNA